VRDEIALEAARRTGFSAGDRDALVRRVRGSPLSVVAALLVEGIKADDVILATCAVTGLAPAPRLLLRRPQIPGGIDVVGVRDAGGTPIGSVQGRTWVAFSDPEAARAAIFSDDVVVCIATDADLRPARAWFDEQHPAEAGALATMALAPISPAMLQAARRPAAASPPAPQPPAPKSPAPKPPAPKPPAPKPHAAPPPIEPAFDEDTLQSGRALASAVEAARTAERAAERTRVTTAPPAPPPPADADRERLERLAQLGRLRRFRFERVLGQGGMATVYLAADRERGDAPVAVKVLAPRLQGEPLAVARFRRELRALLALRHRHIVPIVDGDTEADSGPCWLACRYLDGGTLRELLSRSGPLPAVAALPIAAAILEAEAHAHAAGVIHRDLKPQNILVGSDGTLCIADFGVASAIGDVPLTSAGTRFGTPAYMSPEQAMGEAVDTRSDLFSTGAILHELLTGQSPFARGTALETMRAVAAGDATPLPPVVVVPGAVHTLRDALLAVDRKARPPDAEAALRVLRPLLAHCPPVDDVIRRLLADPRAFADAAAVADDMVAADATVGDELLAGPTRDIESLAAGFDDDPVIPAPRPPPRAPPAPATTFALPPSTTPPPPVTPSPPPVTAPTPGAAPAALPASVAPTPPSEGRRAAVLGFTVVLIVGVVVLVGLWLRR